MGKEEFLRGLEQALVGEVPTGVIRENLNYYNQYITEEAGKGVSERDVIEAIGDPRLIARTIIDSTLGVDGTSGTRDTSYGSAYTEQGEPAYERRTGQAGSSFHYYDLNKWYWKLLGVVIVLGILFLVLTIVGGIFSLVLPLLPVILIIYIVMIFFRGMRR